MRTFLFLLEKEFRQMLRNRQLLSILLIAPLIQLILLPLAADYTVKNIAMAVVDQDHSPSSRRLIEKITSSGYFKLTGYTASYNEALALVQRDKADLVLQIPAHFERDLVKENAKDLYISIDAIEGTKANLGGAYLSSIVSDFNSEIRLQWLGPAAPDATPQVTVAPANWYNALLNYHLYMVPAILVTLVTAMATMQSAFNIVQEKESGTIEQINVTPIRKHWFILGKLIPYMVLSIIVFTLGLLAGWAFYGIVPVGNLLTLYGALIVYLFAMLGMGLLISTYSATQQQAMSLSFFFINIFNLMSGIFTAVDSMPDWAQYIVETFPPSHFIKIMRMVVLKGSDWSDIGYHLGAMALIGLGLNVWAILNYRKTV
ncbi:ABC transporter permease [Dinghuibacter silviterrae]|uniref:ABC-2 type transport system permease protein n=1 Tax=Dinghuibacter silviterrae TaxID=1539049 RepID=A0A4R8DFM0_9BACT|nr:ABC transporter permease [Dinghuibacter silviterrae]TDW96128.1 ABC-2 type transport system permease protein [Dinghuibacter silviterrae]